MTSTAISLPPLVAARRQSDFADWLSPILVKELRQGLKSRMFVVAFVLVQAAMTLIVGLRLLTLSQGIPSADSFYEGLFVFCVTLPMLVVMPARGLVAIGEETRAQTLDLVQLTRLSAFRIVWGKWLALVAQTFLLCTTILPYAILRYYFGQVNVAYELAALGMMFVASMVLTAAAVGISSAHIAVRIFLLVLIVPALIFYGGVLASGWLFRGSVSAGSSEAGNLLAFVLGAALYIYFFLELGASRIAPPAENHSARKRLLALLLSAGVALFGWCADTVWISVFVAVTLPVVAFTVVEALCEPPISMPNLYLPFVKRGWLGRWAGCLLYPGWATGTFFTAVVVALLWCGVVGSNRLGDTTLHHVMVTASGFMVFFALVSPLPILQLFPRLKSRFWPYVLVQALSVLFFSIVATMTEPGNRHEEVLQILSPVPTSALLVLMTRWDVQHVVEWTLRVAAFADLVLTIWLAALLRRQFVFIAEMERLSVGESAGAPEASVEFV